MIPTSSRLSDPRALQFGDLVVEALDHLADGVLIADAQDCVAYWNEVYVQRLPYLRAHMRVGRPVIDLIREGAKVVLPHSAQEEREKWVEWRMRTRREGRGQVEFTFPDGHTVVFIDRRLDSGGTVCLLRDHTDVKEAERQLLLERERAEAANLRKTRFLADVTQEIRTATQGVLGMAQLLGEGGLEPEQTREHAEVIHRSSQSLINMLNDLLEHARIEEGKVMVHSARFRPGDLLMEMSALYGPQVQDRGLSLQVHWAGRSDDVFLSDPEKIRQMVVHLLHHALQHTLHGHVRLEAGLEQDSSGSWIEFLVTDTGVGIPVEHEMEVFEPFSQVRAGAMGDSVGSSGLGLSIVKGLALSMGGRVGVRSPGKQGCCLWFRIPAVVSAPSVVPPSRPQTSGSEPWSVSRMVGLGPPSTISSEFPMLVLVVDDDIVNRQVLALMLRRLGCTVIEAENGFAALTLLQAEPRADLVFMDCTMPVMDGFEATRHLRDWEFEHGKSRTPVVALTARAFDNDKDACIQAGMDDFLTKPVEMVAIQLLVDTHRRPAQTASLSHDAVVAPAVQDMPLPLFDSHVLLDRLEDDHSIATRVVAIYLSDLPGYIHDLVEAARELSPSGLIQKAHVLAGASSNVSATELARRAKQIEQWAQQGAWADVIGSLDDLKSVAEQTRQALDAFVSAHS